MQTTLSEIRKGKIKGIKGGELLEKEGFLCEGGWMKEGNEGESDQIQHIRVRNCSRIEENEAVVYICVVTGYYYTTYKI